MVSNLHYQHFFPPVDTDSSLGALTGWAQQPALLLLDCFAPENRRHILEQAAQHGNTVWILRSDQPSRRTADDIRKQQELRAERVVDLPAKSLVHHHTQCLSAAKWDSQSSRYTTQFWLLRSSSQQGTARIDPNFVREQLGCWETQRYDFHHESKSTTCQMRSYRIGQQDAVRFTE